MFENNRSSCSHADAASVSAAGCCFLLPSTTGTQPHVNCQCADFCDVTVMTSSGSWRLHSLLLASRSEFFHRALAGEFTESHSKVIELHLEKSEAVSLLALLLVTLPGYCCVCDCNL
eukprot:GHRQ01011951.1.p1 GENE.GHRQ01011951.1~~GHRQ01011951.1.p1  ORF type:complete len:117 (+),score=13.11 GHRQ01011951.1:351-701(+)